MYTVIVYIKTEILCNKLIYRLCPIEAPGAKMLSMALLFHAISVRHWDAYGVFSPHDCFNSLRPRQNDRHFPDDTFRRIFLNENLWTLLKISLKIFPKVRINNIPALVQIMAWRRPGDKPLSEPMMVSLPTHICVTRPQWVNNFGDQLSHTSNAFPKPLPAN